MSDYLVDLGEKPAARKIIKTLGLPIPMPQKLDRSDQPWVEKPLTGKTVIVCHPAGSNLADACSGAIGSAGADCRVLANKTVAKSYDKACSAAGGSSSEISQEEIESASGYHSMVFDASGLKTPADLKQMFNFFHAGVRNLAANGRILIVSPPPESASSPAAAACYRAVNGFTRSTAREIGKRGATANLIYVDPGSETAAEPAIRFILSNRSAYISAQPIHVSARVTPPSSIDYTAPLAGKVAFVTGAARGIGAKTATALAREGARVVGLDRPAEKDALVELTKKIGGEWMLGDILEDGAPAAIADEIRKRFSSLDIVVHNAGVTRDKTLANMTDQMWDMTLGVNLIALIELNEQLIKSIKSGGRIIAMASIAGIAGNMGQTNYSSSKAGVIGYVQSLAPSMAKKNITVNAVAPGFIETQMTAAIPFATREVARRLCNLSQGGLPEDIAELITFLASPGAYGISGEVVRICGGNYIGA